MTDLEWIQRLEVLLSIKERELQVALDEGLPKTAAAQQEQVNEIKTILDREKRYEQSKKTIH